MVKVHRLVSIRPNIIGCWEADSSYIASKLRSSEKLYFCFREDYRVVVLKRKPEYIVPTKVYPPKDLCISSPVTSSSIGFLQKLKLPCYIHAPCICFCYQEEGQTPSTRLCDEEGNCHYEPQDLYCEYVNAYDLVNILIYPTNIVRNIKIYRYFVTIGESKAYVAPYPLTMNMSIAFEYVLKSSRGELEDYYKKLLKKYGGNIPDAVNFFGSYLPIDASVVYPEGVPEGVELYMNRYVFVNPCSKTLAFNFYPIGSNKFHAVVIAWFDSDDRAYRVARVAWEIRKDVTVPYLQFLRKVRRGRDFISSQLLTSVEDLFDLGESNDEEF